MEKSIRRGVEGRAGAAGRGRGAGRAEILRLGGQSPVGGRTHIYGCSKTQK